MKTTIVNKYHKVPYDVYIGRGSDFGNPYVIGIDGDRDAVIRKYREYFYKRVSDETDFKSNVESLKGKTLACFCKPKSCHGDVIIEYLDGVFEIKENSLPPAGRQPPGGR